MYLHLRSYIKNKLTVIKLKPNLYTTYIELYKHFGKRDRETNRNGCFHQKLIRRSKNLNCWAQLQELIPCQYARTYLKPQTHGEIILGDAHSKYILIILVIDSWNFRELQEWFSEFEEDRRQNRKLDSLLIKMWNFSRMGILKPQNSISWAGSITNEIMLLYF